MITASTQRSRFRATSATGFASAERRVRLQGQHVAAQLVNGDLEGRARPQRRLLEQHRDMTAAEHVGGRRVAAERPIGLELRREVETALEIGRVEVEHRQEVLPGSRQLGHGVNSGAVLTFGTRR